MWLCVKMRQLSGVLWTREAFIPLLHLQRESSTTFGLVLATALTTSFFGRQRDSNILGCSCTAARVNSLMWRVLHLQGG
jgi:hypothetical protein